jgi:hypothetical protein
MELESNIVTRIVLFEKEKKVKSMLLSGSTVINIGYIRAPYVSFHTTAVVSEPVVCSGLTTIYAFTGATNLSKYALLTVNQDYYSSINLSDF